MFPDRPHPAQPSMIPQEWHQCHACLGWGRVRGAKSYLETQRALRDFGWTYMSGNGKMLCPGCTRMRSHPDRVITQVDM